MPSRRRLLAALGAGIGLAGCTSGPMGPPAGSDRTSPDDQTGAPESDPPSGPGVDWTAFLGPGPVSTVAATAEGVYAVGGRNDRGTPNPERHLGPKSSRNLVSFTPGGERRWRYEAEAGVYEPTPADGGVYAVVGWDAGTHGVDQRVVYVEGGERQWATRQRSKWLGVLAAGGGGVYVGTGDDARGPGGEAVFAVGRDGSQRWSVESGDATTGAVHDGTLYVSHGGSRFMAVSTGDGRERWRVNGGSVNERPRPASGHVYLERPQETGSIYPIRAVDPADGSTEWSFGADVGGDGRFLVTGAARRGDTVYVTEYDGTLYALDAADGTERWRYDAGGDAREGAIVVGDTIYLGAFDDGIHAVAPDGERRWHHALEDSLYLRGADADGVAVKVVGERDRYVAVGPDGGERWSFTAEDDGTPSATVGSRVYLGTADGYLVALDG